MGYRSVYIDHGFHDPQKLPRARPEGATNPQGFRNLVGLHQVQGLGHGFKGFVGVGKGLGKGFGKGWGRVGEGFGEGFGSRVSKFGVTRFVAGFM